METKETELLVRKTAEGDMDAFEKLYQLTNRRVYFICLNFLRNEQDAKDAVQDTYLTAFKNIRQLKAPEKFGAWVERIAVNRCKDILKKNQPVPVDDDVFRETLLTEDEFTIPEKYIIDKEKRRILWDIMRTELTELQYQAIILYYFNNLSIREIAEIMECSEGAVKNRLSKARTAIKKAIEKYQKDKDDKLFVFAGVPFLAKVFDEESKALNAPMLNTAMMAGSSGTGSSGAGSSGTASSRAGSSETASSGTASSGAGSSGADLSRAGSSGAGSSGAGSSGSGSSATGSATPNLAGTALKTGGMAMKKILIGILAGVVAVGGITAAVIIANSGKTGVQTKNPDSSSVREISLDDSDTDSVSENSSDNSVSSQSDNFSDDSGQDELNAQAASEDDLRTGQCGDNAFYSISEDGVLTISGTGAIYDYGSEEENRNPWHDISVPYFHTVVIEDGITRIGSYAFLYCDQKDTIIPDSVTEIGEYAFTECNSIDTIQLPESIVKIEEGAFADSALRKINIPENVTEIPDKMCYDCWSMTELVISEGVERIGSEAFECCEALTELTLPDTLTEIDKYAFYSCREIKEVTIPEKVSIIVKYAFFDWEDDQTIYVKGKTEAPEGWDEDWKSDYVNVVWDE